MLADEVTAADSAPLFKSKTSFWISNQMHFEDATFELVEILASLKSVSGVRVDELLPVPEVIVSSTNESNSEAASLLSNAWGITKIGAPAVWAMGHTGQRVVVGILDTGTFVGHKDLKSNFRIQLVRPRSDLEAECCRSVLQLERRLLQRVSV
ncbi:hypothetical protein Gpo141_00003076 [Globisporangium polare]